MKNKLLSILLFVCLVISFPSVSEAESKTEHGDVEPNVYEKREINIRKSNRNNLIERKELPEEQRKLTFDKDKATESERIMDELFQSSEIETNTITSKAAQMKLFSLADKKVKRDTEEEEVTEGINVLMIVMMITIVIIIALLLLIIPRLQDTRE